MEIIKKSKALLNFPQLNIFMGSPKVGKSTIMAKCPKALILDLEGTGYQSIDTDAKIIVMTLSQMKESISYFFSEQNKEFDTLIIDHLRMVSNLYSEAILKENNVRFLEEVGYGKGVSQLKNYLFKFIKGLKTMLTVKKDKKIIIVAHTTDRNGEIRIDVDGKNETMILGEVDSVGYIYRNNNEETCITFKGRTGVEFGTRNKNLANYDGVLDWQILDKIANGK